MDLTARAGLALVAETLQVLGVDEVVRDRLRVRRRQRGYTEFDKLHAIVLVQAAGGEVVEHVRVLARHAGLTRLLHRPLPSPDALHDFLAARHDEGQMAQRSPAGAWIPAEPAALQALAALNTVLVHHAVAGLSVSEATLDLDVAMILSGKRDALPLYNTGGRGYQPTAVCWAELDLVAADQYRLKYLVGERIAFTISADMTQDLLHVWTAPGVAWASFGERPGTPTRPADTSGPHRGAHPCDCAWGRQAA